MALGIESTRIKLMDENRRPRSVSGHWQFPPQFVREVQSGPSGMSGEHLKTMLESPSCLGLLSHSGR